MEEMRINWSITCNDKVIDMVKDIADKAKKGEKTGNIECPYCGGTIKYVYENDMAMRVKCLQCGFFVMS